MKSPKSRGFTYTELIVGIMVIAITSIFALQFYRFCQKNFIINSTLKLTAFNFARETLEGLYLREYENAALAAGTADYPLPPAGTFGNELATEYAGIRNSTVTQRPSYKVVQVVVNWTP